MYQKHCLLVRYIAEQVRYMASQKLTPILRRKMFPVQEYTPAVDGEQGDDAANRDAHSPLVGFVFFIFSVSIRNGFQKET